MYRTFYAERYELNGHAAYSVEAGIRIDTEMYSQEVGYSMMNFDSETENFIKLVTYYGYDYPGHNTMNYYLASQELIWEKITLRDVYWYYLPPSGYKIYNIDNELAEINRLISLHSIEPSFINEKIYLNNGENIIVDQNNVLEFYEITNTNLKDVRIEQNKLIINIDNYDGLGTIELSRTSYYEEPGKLYYSGNNQKLVGTNGIKTSISIINTEMNEGTITLTKLDSRTGDVPIGDAKLTGAVYEVIDNKGVVIDTLINGLKNTTTSLPYGEYIVKEKTPGTGYQLDKKEYNVVINDNNNNVNLTVYENVIENNLIIQTVYEDIQNDISNYTTLTQFDIYLKSTNKLYTSCIPNDSGLLSITLPYGEYLIKQVSGPENYELAKPFEVSIQNSQDNITKVITENKIKSKIWFTNRDLLSQNAIKQSDVEFKIKNLDTGNYVCQNISCTYKTNNEGYFITDEPLEIGNYQVEQVEDQIVNGYIYNNEPLIFEINKETIEQINNENILQIDFLNNRVYGELYILVTGEEYAIVDNQFVYSDVRLNNIAYDVYAGENVYSNDGELIYNKGDLVTQFKTGEGTPDGTYIISQMYLGKYCLVNTSSNLEYVVSNEDYCIDFIQENQYDQFITGNINIKLSLPKGTLSLFRKEFSFNKPIPDSKINIYTEEDILIFSGITDEFGQMLVERLPLGKYYLKEIEAPSGHVLNEEIIPFEITEDGQIVDVYMINEEVKIPNTGLHKNYTIFLAIIISLTIGIGLIRHDQED